MLRDMNENEFVMNAALLGRPFFRKGNHLEFIFERAIPSHIAT